MNESARDVDRLMQSWDQRRVKVRSLQAVGPLIQRVATRRGLTSRLGREALEAAWRSVAENRWPHQTRVGSLRNGALEVRVNHSMIIQELTFEQEALLAKIKEALPDATIRRLVFRIGR